MWSEVLKDLPFLPEENTESCHLWETRAGAKQKGESNRRAPTDQQRPRTEHRGQTMAERETGQAKWVRKEKREGETLGGRVVYRGPALRLADKPPHPPHPCPVVRGGNGITPVG